jgi:hypothetical protein
MTRPQIQAEIPGTEDTTRDPAMDERLWSYLDGKEEQARIGRDLKLRLSVLFAAMAEKGIDRIPYIDRASGKRKFFYADRSPKPKTTKEPRARKPKDEKKAEKQREKKEREQAESVEHRKVSRAEVEKDIGPLDPFAATREAMEAR